MSCSRLPFFHKQIAKIISQFFGHILQEAITSPIRGEVGSKYGKRSSRLEFKAWACCKSVLYSTVSQQRFISKDWDELGELNFVWYISSAFFNPSVKNTTSWPKESAAEQMRCSITSRSLPILRASRHATRSSYSLLKLCSFPSQRSQSQFHSPRTECWRTDSTSQASAFSQKRPSGCASLSCLRAVT